MKVSYNWLKTFIDFDYSPQELSDILTMLGLEVAGFEETGGIPGNLEGVVVGFVVSAEKHPNADRLKVCKVDIGADEPLSIVCGAPNVAAGQKVPVALVGTTLHPFKGDPIKLKKGKIRGEVSMGMICAEDELGLGEDHDGILVLDEKLEIGSAFIDALELDTDYIIEIELTPNRIDGASHYGVARDLAAFMRKKATIPDNKIDPSLQSTKNPIKVSIENPDRCFRYISHYIEGVQIQESPEWMQKRLKSIGLRPINNVVDITNYVMMELGHPMHAFDADELKGKEIIAKTLDKETTFNTLDDIERKIVADTDLMICDAERALCIGGVMGGLNSGVTAKTKNVFLETAYFDPGSVRKTSKRLAINSDSSYRYERGVDPEMTAYAAQRATQLILEIAGGNASSMESVGEEVFPPFELDFSLSRANVIYGISIPKKEQIEILEALEIQVEESKDQDLLHLKVPTYRVDVQRPEDVMEEILRVYGYNNVPIPAPVNMSLNFKQYQDVFGLKHRYADYLSANGFYETLTISMVPAEMAKEDVVHVLNPLSEDLGIMRQSMLPGMMDSILYNQNRQNENLALYEFGKTYATINGKYEEQEWLSLAISGKNHGPHWREKGKEFSLFGLSKEWERIEAWFKINGEKEELTDEDWEYGIAVKVQNKLLARYGKVSQEWTDKYDIKNEVFYLLADWEALSKLYFQTDITFSPIPQYPSIKRDISMLIDETTSFKEIRQTVFKANPKLIRTVELHDIYKGKGIAEGKKSYLISIELRDDHKTLEDKSADKISKRIFQLLEKELEVEIRK